LKKKRRDGSHGPGRERGRERGRGREGRKRERKGTKDADVRGKEGIGVREEGGREHELGRDDLAEGRDPLIGPGGPLQPHFERVVSVLLRDGSCFLQAI